MNETMSLLLATAILAAGGLGLYMYKSNDENQKGGDNYNEDSLFGSGNFWGSGTDDKDEIDEQVDEDLDDYEYKPRSRQNKTKRNTRRSSGTKRRY